MKVLEQSIDRKCYNCACNKPFHDYPIACTYLKMGWDDPHVDESLENEIQNCPGPFRPKVLGIDLHGVLDAHPEILRPVLKALRLLDLEVVIISGPPSKMIIDQLSGLGFKKKVHYTGIASVVDWLKLHHVPMWQDYKGDWWTEDLPWNEAKSQICQELEVDVLIDDCKAYEEFFTDLATKFVLTEKLKKTKPTS